MDKIRSFSVVTYGNLEKYNETISKARCRIFYKGLNRNGSYISDEFAEKLLSTISYAPVKGIYTVDDFEDHGRKNSDGRIYGIVPENPNVSWEKFLDDDGVEREYACVDVYIFTALYEETVEVIGKAQSMEIYEPSVRGEWTYMKGRRVFKFTDGCFLGLQVLGEEVEPCFEGAAFFSLYDNIVAAFEKIEALNDSKNTNVMGGNSEMNFKISYSQVEQALWSLLNTNFTEEAGWEVTHSICELYDDYALVRNFNNGTYERVYYAKNAENDEVSITDTKTCYIVDVTKSEYTTLKAVQAINNNTFEAIDTQLNELADVKAENETIKAENEEVKAENETVKADYAAAQEQISANEQKIGEQEETISTLTTERDNFSAQATEAGELIVTLQGQIDTLTEYKADIESKEKKAIIAKYSEKLSEDVIADYTARIADFDAIELGKELAFALVNTDPTIFSAEPDSGLVPKNQSKTGIEALLDQYRDSKKNK